MFAGIERVLAGERSVWDSRDLGEALIQEQSADADVKVLIHTIMFKRSLEIIFASIRGWIATSDADTTGGSAASDVRGLA